MMVIVDGIAGYHGDDEVIFLTRVFDGMPDTNGYEWGWSASPAMPVRAATERIWADYCIRQGHARAVAEKPPLGRYFMIDGSRYRTVVEDEWYPYRVIRESDGSVLDLDKTLAEQGLTDHKIWVRFERVV